MPVTRVKQLVFQLTEMPPQAELSSEHALRDIDRVGLASPIRVNQSGRVPIDQLITVPSKQSIMRER